MCSSLCSQSRGSNRGARCGENGRPGPSPAAPWPEVLCGLELSWLENNPLLSGILGIFLHFKTASAVSQQSCSSLRWFGACRRTGVYQWTKSLHWRWYCQQCSGHAAKAILCMIRAFLRLTRGSKLRLTLLGQGWLEEGISRWWVAMEAPGRALPSPCPLLVHPGRCWKAAPG